MLQIIRDRAQGVIAWIIIILIVIPFALWGVNEYIQDDTVLLAAKVDDVEIPLEAFERSYQSERDLRQRMQGKDFDPSLIDTADMKKSAIDRLINSTVLSSAAVESGLTMSDEQLAQNIRNMREFQVKDQFDQARYTRLLNSLGMNQGRFEHDLRGQYLTEQLMNGLRDSEFVLPQELDVYEKLSRQSREIAYLVLTPNQFFSGIKVNDDEIQAEFSRDKERFMSPERVSIEYVELNRSDLASEVPTPSDDVLKKEYEERKADFGIPEQRRAHHILIAVAKGASQEADDKARAKAETLKKKLAEGVRFEDLAKQVSDDPGSAKKGGDLGFFERGMMTQPFEDAVFSMSPGDLSEPVRSQFGWHLIRMDEIHKTSAKPFAAVRARLLRDYKASKGEARFYDSADRLTDLVYEHPDTLDVAADELGLDIKASARFSRETGDGIAGNAVIRRAAFAPDVLTEGNNSDVLQLDAGNRLLVLRIKTHDLSQPEVLEVVKERIRTDLIQQAAAKMAKEKGQEVLSRIQQGDSLSAVEKLLDIKWQRPGFLHRNAPRVPAEIARKAFLMPRPRDQTPVIDSLVMSDGGYAIIQLSRVDETGVIEKKSGQTDTEILAETLRQKQADMQLLRSGLIERDRKALLESVKARKDIVIYQNNL